MYEKTVFSPAYRGNDQKTIRVAAYTHGVQITSSYGPMSNVSPVAALEIAEALKQAAYVSDPSLTPKPPATPAPKPTKASPKGRQAYLGNGKHEMEKVMCDESHFVERLRVPGGWLYTTTVDTVNGDTVSTTAFVPVPDAVGYAV